MEEAQMPGQEFSFIEKEHKCFLSYTLENGDNLVKTELEMLKNNDIPGILPVSEIHDNGRVSLLYNITSKYQFSQRMEGVFNGSQLYNMLKTICKMLMLLDEYMVNPGHVIFNLEFMFFDCEKDEAEFAVLPLKNIEEVKNIQKFLIKIFTNLKYSDSTLMDFPAYIYGYINNNLQINIKEFSHYLEDTYNALCGIIKPSGEVPAAPAVNYNTEKEIIDTEEVKKNVQSRFITQNERIIALEAVTEKDIKQHQIQNAGKGDSTMPGITPGSFTVPAPPTPKGAFTTPPAKKKKQKEKPPKKTKEKPVKEVKEKPVKEKKEDKPKEKKGLFGFGRKNKKENNNGQAAVPQPPKPPVIQPVNNINNARVPVPPVPYTPPQPFINSQPGMIQVPFANNPPSVQAQYINGIQQTPGQNQQIQQVPPVQQVLPVQQIPPVQQVPPVLQTQPPVWTAKAPGQKEKIPPVIAGNNSLPPDPDMTTILPGADNDFDSTLLLEQVNNMPALRSRVTGEVIQIGHTEFITGRNKVINGRIVEMPKGQQPDASINIKSISHTHAVFLWHDSKWHVQDKNSLNGTFVNGERLNNGEEKALNEGDIICFASKEYEYILVK